MARTDEAGAPKIPDLGAIETLGSGELCVDGFCGVPEAGSAPAGARQEAADQPAVTGPDDDDSQPGG